MNNIFKILILVLSISLGVLSETVESSQTSLHRTSNRDQCEAKAQKWKKKILSDLGGKCNIDHKVIKEDFYKACKKEIDDTCSADAIENSKHPKRRKEKCSDPEWIEARLKKDNHQNHFNAYSDIWSKCGGGEQDLAKYKEKIEEKKQQKKDKAKKDANDALKNAKILQQAIDNTKSNTVFSVK